MGELIQTKVEILFIFLLMTGVLWMLVVFPGYNVGYGFATKIINACLVILFPSHLLPAQELLKMEEQQRPSQHRPPPSFLFVSGSQSAPFYKLLLVLCNLSRPPDPREYLLAFIMWETFFSG